MASTATVSAAASIESQSIVHGIPLTEEAGIGALTIPGYLAEVARRYGEREAVVMHYADSVERWTYTTLWQQSVQVAKALIASGLSKDQRVGILMTNRPQFLTALFGTAIAGGVAVVFSTFSTRNELEQLLKLSDVSMLLLEAQVLKTDFAAMLAELEPALLDSPPGELQSQRFPYLRRLVQLDSPDAATAESARQTSAKLECLESWKHFISNGARIPDGVVNARAATVLPADAACLFFSSGTTSLPKGILHSQRAFALQWWRFPKLTDIQEPVRCWTANGFFWSGNIAMAVGLTLSNGGTVILQSYFDPEAALRLIEAERVTFLYGRPHQWARLQQAPNWQSSDLSSLRYITRGEILWTHPSVATDWCIPMGYGNTESMSISTSNAFNRSSEAVPASFGTPLPGNSLKIVDPDTRDVVPVGCSGEICIKGPTMMMGYIGKSTEECFDAQGYFPTGDGGHVDAEGRLFFEGRITEIIKTGGANVSPVEIDEALVRYPGVHRAKTIGIPHETLGEMIVACVVANEGVVLDKAAITAYLKERLASYKVPKEIVFLEDGDMEITGSGKVKLAQLRALLSSRL